MGPSLRPADQPSLEYHTPRRRLPGPAVWLGIPAVVFASGSIACLFFAVHSDWLPDDFARFITRSIGWPSDVFSTAAIVAWFLGLLLGFAGMYLPKGNRLLPALALLLCVLGLATGGILTSWHW